MKSEQIVNSPMAYLGSLPADLKAAIKKAVLEIAVKDKAAFDKIVSHESGWNHMATNSSSGAYGLVQALPASKMASAGSDWKTNPATQITWGLNYIGGRYGNPCGAYSHHEAKGWY